MTRCRGVRHEGYLGRPNLMDRVREADGALSRRSGEFVMNDDGFVVNESDAKGRGSFLLHMAIAIFCVPLYILAPALTGLLVSPYLVYLILKPRSVYLLPLIVHTFYGSWQQYLMLIACLLYCLGHVYELRRRGLLSLFCVYMLGVPFFIWYTAARYQIFGGGIGHGGTFEGITYYLAFIPFFWCAIAIKRIEKGFFMGLLLLSLWFVLSGFVGFRSLNGGDDALLGTFSRFSSWGGVYVVCVFIWSYFAHASIAIRLLSGLGSLMFFLGFFHVGGALIPFHLVGSALLGCAIICLSKWCRPLAKCLHPWILLTLTTLAVFSAIGKFENAEIDLAGRGSYEDNNTVRDAASLANRIYLKLYGDRAPVWTASFNAVKKQMERSFIFVDPAPVFGEIEAGKRHLVIEIQAHNLFLELLRLYGGYGGGICILVFCLILGQRTLRKTPQKLSSPLVPILACAMGHCLFGSFGGHYLVTRNFSFTLFGLLGLCYSYVWSSMHRRWSESVACWTDACANPNYYA